MDGTGWNAPARKFIQSQPQEIGMLTVLQEYHEKVASFHRWLQREWDHAHSRELHEAEMKRQAVLAKKSTELVLRIRQRLQREKTKGPQLLDLLSEALSAEELYQLKNLSALGEDWVNEAICLAGSRYLLPDDLKAELLALGKNQQLS